MRHDVSCHPIASFTTIHTAATTAAIVGFLCLAALTLLVSCAPRQEPNSALHPGSSAAMDAAGFEDFVQDVFMPIYPVLAEQIIDDTMMSNGLCLDAGAGGGHLSIELARMSTMTIECTDIDPDAVAIARANVAEAGLEDRVECAVADVQALPYADATFDLVVSRGSFLFWEDKAQGFREIHRVLKPGGQAYIGGGMGRRLPLPALQRIKSEMASRGVGPGVDPIPPEKMESILRDAGISDFRIMSDREDGHSCTCSMWVLFSGE